MLRVTFTKHNVYYNLGTLYFPLPMSYDFREKFGRSDTYNVYKLTPTKKKRIGTFVLIEVETKAPSLVKYILGPLSIEISSLRVLLSYKNREFTVIAPAYTYFTDNPERAREIFIQGFKHRILSQITPIEVLDTKQTLIISSRVVEIGREKLPVIAKNREIVLKTPDSDIILAETGIPDELIKKIELSSIPDAIILHATISGENAVITISPGIGNSTVYTIERPRLGEGITFYSREKYLAFINTALSTDITTATRLIDPDTYMKWPILTGTGDENDA